jgi:hypothetical protein
MATTLAVPRPRGGRPVSAADTYKLAGLRAPAKPCSSGTRFESHDGDLVMPANAGEQVDERYDKVVTNPSRLPNRKRQIRLR